MQYLSAVSSIEIRNQNDFCLFPRQTIQYHSNPSLCPNQKCQRSWSWMVLWRPAWTSRTNIKKRCLPYHRGLECKSRRSSDTKWSRAKANRVLPRKHIGHIKHPLPTTQEKILHMDITRWSIPKSDWLYSLQPKIEALYSQQKQDWELTVTQSWTPYCQIQT